MTESAVQPSKPLRTWRPMAGWTLGILAALGLAWVVGAVVVPVWQTRSIVVISYGRQPASPPGYDTKISSHEAIRRLGGTSEARRRLNSYVRLPNWAAPDKHRARSLLEYCDEQDAWATAADTMLRSLEAMLEDKDPNVRQAAAEALKKIRGQESGK